MSVNNDSEHQFVNNEAIEYVENTLEVIRSAHNRKEKEIKELQTNISEMKKKLTQMHVQMAECEENSLRDNEELKKLKEEKMILKKELDDSLSELESLKKDVDCLKEGIQPSKRDKAVLEKNRILLKTYRDLTGLKWDFSAPVTDFAGSIQNPASDYCNYFHYPAAKENSEKVWKEIEKAGHADWSDIKLTENCEGPSTPAKTLSLPPDS